ncbi:MAG: TlpA family protein disulfide reductase [Bacteroidaceae bacterium]|nr:TlpA family protein disulfide reductase [Bacteroidaceae bacterium]MBR3916375.1 TlpA family protein disulfide reductase [Bacteroidaceae bacterium]
MKNNFITLLLIGAFCISCNSAGNNAKPAEESAPVASEVKADSVTVYEHDYIVKVGDVAPDFTLELIDGTKFTLSENRGKVVMLQFTAGWCGICRKEMPFIESDIWQRHKDNSNFVLLGIDREETKDEILPFLEKVGTTYPIAMDTNADVFASYALRNSGITRNVLIDRDGKIVMLTRKFEDAEFKALVEKIDSMLKQ